MNNFLIGTLFAMLAVILGAFGAHALKAQLSANDLLIWETAVKYQFYHALALIVVALWQQHLSSQWLGFAGIFFSVGIVLFSGSLYSLCLLGTKFIGIITPIGGLSFILGWMCLLMASRVIKR